MNDLTGIPKLEQLLNMHPANTIISSREFGYWIVAANLTKHEADEWKWEKLHHGWLFLNDRFEVCKQLEPVELFNRILKEHTDNGESLLDSLLDCQHGYKISLIVLEKWIRGKLAAGEIEEVDGDYKAVQ